MNRPFTVAQVGPLQSAEFSADSFQIMRLPYPEECPYCGVCLDSIDEGAQVEHRFHCSLSGFQIDAADIFLGNVQVRVASQRNLRDRW